MTDIQKAAIHSITIMRQPVRCITTTRHGPQEALASVVVIALGGAPGGDLHHMKSWRAELVFAGTADYIDVDVPAETASRRRVGCTSW